jgi:hydrogenase expression/formation protein HypC
MCIGIPGKILDATEGSLRMGRVAFGEVIKQVSLALVPEAQVGEYVLVHAGTAIQVLDEAAAQEVLDLLEELAESMEDRP